MVIPSRVKTLNSTFWVHHAKLLVNKGKDLAGYTINMSSDGDLWENWKVVCVVKLFLVKSQGYLVKMFMNIYSTLILTTGTASLADSHTPHLRVYCVPAACAPALAATFPDAFAPHPGPKTSGHPAWPGATPGMTPARPHHTSTHKNNIYGRNHNQKNNHHLHTATNSLIENQEPPRHT